MPATTRGPHMTSTITAHVEVDVPLGEVYDQWTRFEEFPEFMNAVKSITWLDGDTTHWVTSIGGVSREFDAVVTERIRDERIGWASVEDRLHTGAVSFRAMADGGTRVDLAMLWEPETFLEKAGAAFNVDALQVEADLTRFKEFIEARGDADGVRSSGLSGLVL